MSPPLIDRLWKKKVPTSYLHTRVASDVAANAWKEPLLSNHVRAVFLDLCWGLSLSHMSDDRLKAEIKPFESYLLHYEESCRHLPFIMHDLSHEDICTIVRHLANSIGLSYDEVVRTLPLPAQSAQNPTKCIEFVGQAVLLLDLTKWTGSRSLPDYIKQELACKSKQKDQFRLPTSFNARTFERVAGVEIKWTHNLSSHLKVGSNMEFLSIFHHVKVLDLYHASPFNRILPSHFIVETRQTLALMMPKGNKASRDWFRRHQEKLRLDAAAGSCPYLGEEKRNVQAFNFWRDRLIIAKEVFDEGQPGNILQVWRDDRNKVQWWTFWIAFVVFWLTSLSVVEGALQAYKAYYPTPTR